MKFSSKYLIGIIVLCIIVFLTTMLASRAIMPYGKSPYQGSNFEGFHGMNKGYATYPSNQAIDTMSQYNITNTSANKDYQRLWGFDGLFGPADIPDNNMDIFSNAPGSLSTQCQNTSSNLTNSMGNLCLDAHQLKMLGTRGGNQSSCASSVGTCSM